METVEILSTVSKLVYENVKDLAGTKEAIAGDLEGVREEIFQEILT